MKYKLGSKYSRGEVGEGVLILAALILVVFVFILPKKDTSKTSITSTSKNPGSAWGTSTTNGSKNINSSSENTPNEIKIGTGNASSEIQTYLEYITLDYRGTNITNITGFKLMNAKDKRLYIVGGNDVHYEADSVFIPKGALYINPNGPSILQNILLSNNDRAIVTTGRISNQIPYIITSFKENLCSGYLESKGDYSFKPSLQNNCPRPSDELGFNNLDSGCQDFLNRFSSCHIPTYNEKNSNGETCNGCVDGNGGLALSCVAFIKAHFEYSSCIAVHKNDPQFSSNTWRIFLGSSHELWADRNETISLYDTLGKIISKESY